MSELEKTQDQKGSFQAKSGRVLAPPHSEDVPQHDQKDQGQQKDWVALAGLVITWGWESQGAQPSGPEVLSLLFSEGK